MEGKMVTDLTMIAKSTLLELFDESVHSAIHELLSRGNVGGLVVCEDLELFVNPDKPSRKAVAFGPGCTYKTFMEFRGQHLGQVPSQFYYATKFYLKEV
jgi:hypothetical protein